MRKPPSRPTVGDPVVVAGEKYRITRFAQDRVFFYQRYGGRSGWARTRRLTYDKVAGVWRTGR